MYNEQEDFFHHKKEIDDFLSCLNDAQAATGSGKTVLDLGAGQGMHAGFLDKHFREVYCSDVIDYTSLYGGEFFKLLQQKYARNGYHIDLRKIHFIRTDAMSLLYKDNFFDMIISFNVFEHIPDPGAALKEMVRCTKGGGYVYIQFDPIWTADTGSHFFHRVPEPWGHLIYDDEEYVSRMKKNGADDSETDDYRKAMNRKRLAYYRQIIANHAKKGDVCIIAQEYWSGLSDEKHREHPFFKRCQRKGFDKEELLLRGGRYLFRVEK